MSKIITCTVCPLGCQVTVAGGKAQGYTCPRGRDWALQEVAAPVRVLTTTVILEGGELALLPVRTLAAVPKNRLRDCQAEASRLCIKAPIRAGEVICRDLAATGISLIATRTVAKTPGRRVPG